MTKLNRAAEAVIRTVISAGNAYQSEILSAVQKYRSGMEEIQRNADLKYAINKSRTASDYTISRSKAQEEQAEEERVIGRLKREYVATRKDDLAARTREVIRKAQDSFQDVAKGSAKTLRNQLEEAILSPISTGFLRMAQSLNEFGVAPSRIELNALITLAEENLSASRCLDALLKKTDAPFTLEYKSPDAYEADLELIEKLGTDDYFCSPISVHSEMLEIFENQKPSRDENSVSFRTGETFDNIVLSRYGRFFDLAMEKLEEMIKTWGAEAKFNEDGEAVKLARQLGRETAEANKVASEALKTMSK